MLVFLALFRVAGSLRAVSAPGPGIRVGDPFGLSTGSLRRGKCAAADRGEPVWGRPRQRERGETFQGRCLGAGSVFVVSATHVFRRNVVLADVGICLVMGE